MKKILQFIQNKEAMQALWNHKGITINHRENEALLIAGAFLQFHKNIIIVKENQYEATQLYNLLSPMINEALLYTVDESFRVETLASSPEQTGERIATLYNLTKEGPHLVVTHIHALLRYIPSHKLFNECTKHISKGKILDIYELQKFLSNAGYSSISQVTQPFYYARRGGIVDVFSMQYDHPIRIEFFDDEVYDIRFFDEKTQRTIESVDEVDLIPASDILYDSKDVDAVIKKIEDIFTKQHARLDPLYQEELSLTKAIDEENLTNHVCDVSILKYMSMFPTSTNIFDYIDHPLVITSSYEEIKANYTNYIKENSEYYYELKQIGKILENLEICQDFSVLPPKHADIHDFSERNDVVFDIQDVVIHNYNEKVLIDSIKDYLTYYPKMIFCLESQHQADMMSDLLDHYDMSYTFISIKDQVFDGINIYLGNISKGFILPDDHLVVLTPKELFANYKPHKKKYFKYKNAKVISNYDELNIGDYVVHDAHGIGQYLGIETLEVQGVHKDYLKIAYQGNDTLFIPVEQFKLIRKYSSAQGKTPTIHKLDGKQWAKEKIKAKKKADDIAGQLIEIYAARMSQPGFAYEEDSRLQIEFEEEFGYELTKDQLRSVNEIKQDMMKPVPMDRLLCGDVGFGKTEVALRAAFKAVLSNKQVAFLCPTTILSMQHYATIKQRFEKFPVNFALLNRFTSAKEKRKILEDIKNGEIDIIVGTHRILSQDIEFKDLGLLIVDEEQRFGVKQKEKIKEYRKTIDVLTLTATPIPRTLQMSLMGIRGLSTIETPPKNRLPVQTYVIEKSRTLIKQVIERELARDGQVFYLYNRTDNIENVAARLELEIPNAKVIVGHGKMRKTDLENVMLKFTEKEYNILVCTTIIETGIDIPNANTIIVEDADKFGLAQLYQIRGRVGRSNRGAYAYLLYQPDKVLSDDARKRLKAIKEFTELGSGYRIAMRDLTIRGGGDILGGDQSGFIDTIGFDTFMDILKETIEEKQGIVQKEKDIERVNIAVDGYIPHDYVDSDYEKLELYRRLEHARTIQSIENLTLEFEDYYGHLPDEVSRLIDKRKLDILASEDFIKEISETKNTIDLYFTKEYSNRADGSVILTLSNEILSEEITYKNKKYIKYHAKLSVLNKEIHIIIDKYDDWLQDLNKFIRELKDKNF